MTEYKDDIEIIESLFANMFLIRDKGAFESITFKDPEIAVECENFLKLKKNIGHDVVILLKLSISQF